MVSTGMHPEPPNSQIEEELRRILGSSAFARPHRLARLLKHLVEHTLLDQKEVLKETLLGMDIFDRGPDFDPRTDPIVRIDARRLRTRLAQYYEDEGASDPIEIVLEPGSYVPSFRSRNNQDAPIAPNSAVSHSVAVLPLVDLSGRPDHGFLSEGLTEEILNRLAQQENLRVIARTSAFQFRPDEDPHQVAKRLRVDTLVRGSIRRDAKRLRITVQLISVKDSRILWSQQYDKPMAEVIDAQETIAREIADKLRNLTGIREERKTAEEPVSLQNPASSAYLLFLQGRHFLNQGTREGFLKSIAHLQKAVEKDSTFAPAWASLAVANISTLLFRLKKPSALVPRARLAAQKAFELDRQLADAHTALALVTAMGDFNLAGAARHFETALQIQPTNGHARLFRAMLCLSPAGHLDEAEDELELVLSRDPVNAEVLTNLGRILYYERRYDLAVRTLHLALDMKQIMGSVWFTLALVYEQMGVQREARDAYRRWSALLSGPFTSAWEKAVEQILMGDRKAARRAADKLAFRAKLAPVAAPGLVADLYIRLGDNDRAFRWLERGYRDRAPRLIHAGVDPAFDAIRGDTRFSSLLKKIVGDTPGLDSSRETRQAAEPASRLGQHARDLNL